MLRILVAEDEAHNRDALGQLLRRMGHEPVLACDGREALDLASASLFDLVISDVRMPRMDGLQFFDAFGQLGAGRPSARTPFVFMTAYGRIEEAVAAMRKGALHFLDKPLRKKDLTALLDEVESARGRNSVPALPVGAGEAAPYSSRAFAEVIETVDKVAGTAASVLLTGESGTGKEVLARRLHRLSARRDGPFKTFHCGAVPETLVESELFGFEKGAFTGADRPSLGLIRAAHHGTFFLDEVATMPLAVQAKLLRVLEDGSVWPLGARSPVSCDVRWVAATNVPLEPLVERGSFREDLLYRLKVVVIELPPLRDRPEDIDPLVDHFMRLLAERESRPPPVVPEATRAVLRGHSWPGNVRELRNVLERAFVLAPGEEITTDLLPPHLSEASRSREIRIMVGSSLQRAEDLLIEETLRSCEGDKNKAASILGVAPRTIYRWAKRQTSSTNF